MWRGVVLQGHFLHEYQLFVSLSDRLCRWPANICEYGHSDGKKKLHPLNVCICKGADCLGRGKGQMVETDEWKDEVFGDEFG